MTQEEKQLLLKDLCARLPYGVKVAYMTLPDTMPKEWDMIGLAAIRFVDVIVPGKYRFATVPVEEVKPYLRPISSMTDEEHIQLVNLGGISITFSLGDKFSVIKPSVFDFLNAHHFDYRGLIEKGLAFEAPEGMYNIK